MFNKPVSVYAMFFMLAIIAGIALHAHRQNVRNAILLDFKRSLNLEGGGSYEFFSRTLRE